MALEIGKRNKSNTHRRFRLLVRLLIALGLIGTVIHPYYLSFHGGGGSSKDRLSLFSSGGNFIKIDRHEWTAAAKDYTQQKGGRAAAAVAAVNQTTTTSSGREGRSANSTAGTPANIILPHRKWAYAFLVGGILNPDTEYRGFLYAVVVAAKRLRDLGSRADVVLFAQLSYKTTETKLPAEEEKLLRSLDIQIKYIPKFAGNKHEGFYSLMIEKFRILTLTEYSRVLYLDSDVMPLCSLDYIFELSDPPKGISPQLKENVALAQKSEPSNAGFFMLQPGDENYAALLQVVRRREEEALAMPYPYFDMDIGWGHRFNESAGDHWRAPKVTKGLKWKWHASFADQGLLYYYTKYVKQQVSFIIRADVENWGLHGGKNGTLQLEATQVELLNQYSCIPPEKHGRYSEVAPYRDFIHFTGKSKPWQQEYEQMEAWLAIKTGQDLSNDVRLLWYSALKLAIADSNATISMDFFAKKPVTMGVASTSQQMYEHLVEKRKRGWSSYQQQEDASTTAPPVS